MGAPSSRISRHYSKWGIIWPFYKESPPLSRNTAALIIAVLFHLLILLIFWFLGLFFAQHPKPATQKEQRIKVSLKELRTRNAALKNTLPPKQKIPPMPKGSQLEKVTKAKPFPTPQEQLPVSPPTPVRPQQTIPKPKKMAVPQKPKTEPIPPKQPYIPFTKAPEPLAESPKEPTKSEPTEANATKAPKEHSTLFAKLSKKQKIAPSPSSAAENYKREGRIPKDIREAYGDTFGKLSEGEQKYLLDNQEIMRRLTQAQLNDTGRTMIPNALRVNDDNIIEFYLHPDGSMTDFRYVHHSNFSLLDEVTKDTIESVYWKYPRPKQKTLIRYKFGYYLRGY